MLPMDLGREVISRREPKVRFLSSAPGSWWHNERPERGHENQFALPELSARCRISQRTLPGTRGNGRDAPIPDLPPHPGTGRIDPKRDLASGLGLAAP